MTTYTNPQSTLNGAVTLNGVLPGIGIPTHDYVGLTYDGSGNVTVATYKYGGSGGTTVATLTLAYDVGGNLVSVTKA